MYSVVLMAALTTGSATPVWHHGGGCWGCGGGCFGGCGGGCFGGGYGDGYGGGYSDSYGCWGGYSNWGFCAASHPGTVAPGAYGVMSGTGGPGTGTRTEELDKPKTNEKNNDNDKETMVPTRAKLVVELPANAKLFIDDMPVKATAGVQTFHTPALEPGRPYYYMVRIERMRDGQPVSETRRMIVRAGQVARADFKYGESEAVRTAKAK